MSMSKVCGPTLWRPFFARPAFGSMWFFPSSLVRAEGAVACLQQRWLPLLVCVCVLQDDGAPLLLSPETALALDTCANYTLNASLVPAIVSATLLRPASLPPVSTASSPLNKRCNYFGSSPPAPVARRAQGPAGGVVSVGPRRGGASSRRLEGLGGSVLLWSDRVDVTLSFPSSHAVHSVLLTRPLMPSVALGSYPGTCAAGEGVGPVGGKHKTQRGLPLAGAVVLWCWFGVACFLSCCPCCVPSTPWCLVRPSGECSDGITLGFSQVDLLSIMAPMQVSLVLRTQQGCVLGSWLHRCVKEFLCAFRGGSMLSVVRDVRLPFPLPLFAPPPPPVQVHRPLCARDQGIPGVPVHLMACPLLVPASWAHPQLPTIGCALVSRQEMREHDYFALCEVAAVALMCLRLLCVCVLALAHSVYDMKYPMRYEASLTTLLPPVARLTVDVKGAAGQTRGGAFRSTVTVVWPCG